MDFQPTTYLRAGNNLNASYQTSNGNLGSGSTAVGNPFKTQFYAPIFPYYEHDTEGNIVYDENGNPMWNMRGMFDQPPTWHSKCVRTRLTATAQP